MEQIFKIILEAISFILLYVGISAIMYVAGWGNGYNKGHTLYLEEYYSHTGNVNYNGL